MRLALLADIHGNLSALEAVLADLARQDAEGIVYLGDLASFGPQPREALRCLKSLSTPDVLGCVIGNGDHRLLNPHPSNADSSKFSDIDLWCATQLSPADLDYLRTFKSTVSLELGGLSVLGFHGSPRSFDDVITATTPDAELAALLEGQTATVMAGGHSHTPLLRRHQDSLVVNPGSVGLPFELPRGHREARNPHWAEYALLEARGDKLSVLFRRVPYDVAPLLEAARTSGMPHAEWWLEGWLR